ncbi:hypothetical protein INR49_001235 [Caranx melampygus]|nr:hypothetical protein INR49_001235 [Caranx melampygus]
MSAVTPVLLGGTFVSLWVLVSSTDGTYECRIFQRKTNRRKRATLLTEPISTIYLAVHQPGEVHSGGRSRDGGGGGGGGTKMEKMWLETSEDVMDLLLLLCLLESVWFLGSSWNLEDT